MRPPSTRTGAVYGALSRDDGATFTPTRVSKHTAETDPQVASACSANDCQEGVVFAIGSGGSYATSLLFWRPGTTGAIIGVLIGVLIGNSNNTQNGGAVALTFDGIKPRVVARVQQGPIGGLSKYDRVTYASDDAVTCSAKAELPRTKAIAPSPQIFVNSGKVSVVAGGPHRIQSRDLNTWSVGGLFLDKN